MRVVLLLCDRCRGEMPEKKGASTLLVEARYAPPDRRTLRQVRYALEMCPSCRAEFAAWLAKAGCELPELDPVAVEPLPEAPADPAPAPAPQVAAPPAAMPATELPELPPAEANPTRVVRKNGRRPRPTRAEPELPEATMPPGWG